MTWGDETWYLKSMPYSEALAEYGGTASYDYWLDGDECEPRTNFTYHGNTNLCGTLVSTNPCSLCGYDTFTDHHSNSFGNQGIPTVLPFPPQRTRRRQAVRWEINADCSEVTLTLFFMSLTTHEYQGTSGWYITETQTMTVSTSWIQSGLPITFTTSDGDVTIESCVSPFPPPPTVFICCWQATISGPSSGPDVVVSRTEASIAECMESGSDPRLAHFPTEQCSLKVVRINIDPETDGVTSGGAWLRYGVSPDYATVTVQLLYSAPGAGYPFDNSGNLPWDTAQVATVPFTTDWFLTPIEVADENDLTLTLSVCGYDVGGDPCWGDKLVCVDLAYDVEPEFDGTYSMPWDGSQYVSEWSDYKTNYRVRVRLVENEETPGTWETWIDVEWIDTEEIESTLVGSEVIECDPDGTPSGGGESEVDEWPVTVTIHECATECLQQTDQMFFTITGLVGQLFTPGTYAISQTGTGYESSWTPIIEGGGGYQIRIRIEWDGVTMCDPPFDDHAYYGAYVDLYDVETEETTTGLLYNFCVDCETPMCHGCDPITTDWPLLITEGLPEEVTIFA